MRTVSRSVRWLAALALAIPGLACTSASTGTSAPSPSVCFKPSQIDEFSPLRGRYVYVRVEINRHFLLTLDRDASGLLTARNIQISPHYDLVCANERAPITWAYEGISGVYNIVGVEAVKDRAEADALAERRSAAGNR